MGDLEGSVGTLGPQHRNTLTSMNNLAFLLQKRGRLDEAEPLFRMALKGRRETLGNRHPHTLSSIRNLAVFLEGRGRLDEAPQLRRELCRSMKLKDDSDGGPSRQASSASVSSKPAPPCT